VSGGHSSSSVTTGISASELQMMGIMRANEASFSGSKMVALSSSCAVCMVGREDWDHAKFEATGRRQR